MLLVCLHSLSSKRTHLLDTDREVKYSFCKRKQVLDVWSDSTWMLHCNGYPHNPTRLVSLLFCTAAQWLHTEDYIPSDSALPSSLFPSIPPVISQLVAHRGDVVHCFIKLYAPSGALRLYLTIKTQIGIRRGRNKKNKERKISQWISDYVFNGVTYGSAEVFSYLVYRRDKMRTTTIKSEMTTPECSNKQLIVSSAVWLNVSLCVFITQWAPLVWLCLQEPREVNVYYTTFGWRGYLPIQKWKVMENWMSAKDHKFSHNTLHIAWA